MRGYGPVRWVRGSSGVAALGDVVELTEQAGKKGDGRQTEGCMRPRWGCSCWKWQGLRDEPGNEC